MLKPYVLGQELAYWWAAIVYNNGSVLVVDEDFSTGWTFQVKVAPAGTYNSAVGGFTKTTGIVGGTGGVTVQWATSGELNSLTAGLYDVELRARNAANADLMVRDRLQVLPAIA